MSRLWGVSAALSVSLAVHAGAIGALDRSFRSYQDEIVRRQQEFTLAQRRKTLQFEFVESPVKTLPQRPESPRKVSDRDALAQDARGMGSSEAPRTRQTGRADQLEQARREGPPAAVPSPAEQVAVPKREAVPESSPERPKTEPGDGQKRDRDEELADVRAAKPSPPQEARQASPPPVPEGLTGNDRITTQEMSRSSSAGTRLRGQVSFEATGSGMGVYMKNLKERIWLAWYPYLAFKYPLDYQGADAVLTIVIDKEGKVRRLSILESSGSPLFASYCLEAVQRASGFGPLPDEILALLGKEELEIRFGFHYR